MKKILLTITLFILVVFAKAQDKYEFMTIEYIAHSYARYADINVSIDGDIFVSEVIEIPKEEKGKTNANPLLKKVKVYQDDAWQVMNIDFKWLPNSKNSANDSKIYFASLRKKK